MCDVHLPATEASYICVCVTCMEELFLLWFTVNSKFILIIKGLVISGNSRVCGVHLSATEASYIISMWEWAVSTLSPCWGSVVKDYCA